MIFSNWTREYTTSGGTGSLTLASFSSGFIPFSFVNTSGRVKYIIYMVDTAGKPIGPYEVGTGTYTYNSPGNTTLTRDVVVASSNSNNLINFGPEMKYVDFVADSTEINALDLFFFGDGNNNTDVTITSSGSALTLTADLYCRNLTISGTGYINTNGWSIFVSDVLDISAAQAGAIQVSVYNGNNAAQPNGGAAANYSATAINSVGGGGSGAAGVNAGTG